MYEYQPRVYTYFRSAASPATGNPAEAMPTSDAALSTPAAWPPAEPPGVFGAHPDMPVQPPDGPAPQDGAPRPDGTDRLLTPDGRLSDVRLSDLDLDEELAGLLDTAEQPMAAPGPPPVRHRRPGLGRRIARRCGRLSWRRLFSFVVAAATGAIVVAMCVLCALISYPSLRDLSHGVVPRDLRDLWPLLVYGPWLAGSLSVLGACLHRRRAIHSWAVVLFFSAFAMLLCTAHAPFTLPGMAVAALPPLTVLLSFHQFVSQIDPARPGRGARHAQRVPKVHVAG